MQVPPEIFKAYDVRGIYPEQLNAEVGLLLGRAFARVLADLRGKPAISGASARMSRPRPTRSSTARNS